ncbi:MAG: YajQ family cyclic di-GMP-binding protein [Pseudomonadales bacterium]|nr:YajQ family cyclic di-GMP-binding protein [Pseudomonadales bacterium]
MPSFDIVSEVDLQEVHNAVDQANRELSTRYDFRGVTAEFIRQGNEVQLTAQADIQLDQMLDILRGKLIKRGVDPKVMDVTDPAASGKLLHQVVLLRQGIESLLAKRIVKLIKDQRLKVQSSIQGEQVRISGKKRDDLQKVINFLKETELDVPLQYQNFRD